VNGDLTIEENAQHFRDAVLANPGLQARLGLFENPAEFEAEARVIAAELGLDAESLSLDPPAPDPLGISRFMDAPVTLDQWPSIGWLPVRAVAGHDGPAFDWAWFGDRALREPLFEDSVRRMGLRPLSRVYRTRTDLAALIAGAAREETLDPDGFVFHMSRCGSTLVAQMLAAVPHHVVASEAAPIDDMLQWALSSGAPFDHQVTALRAIVAALGRNRSGAARRYFLKLDAWHIFALPLFRAAFPETPWIFLYRQPAEVVVSHVGMPGMHFVTGMLSAAEVVADDSIVTMEDRGAAVLARYLDAAVQHFPSGRGMLVNYADLLPAMQLAIPAHFDFVPDADERTAMLAATTRHSKAPDQAYSDDTARKRAAVTPAIAAAVDSHLRDSYVRIEALRQAASATA
jgi:hypothetical protein